MIDTQLGKLVLPSLATVALLSMTAIGAAQCVEPGCGAAAPYPESAYDAYSLAPMPGEAPRDYFARQFDHSRGTYGSPGVEYEMYPSPPADSDGQASLSEATESFASYNNADPSDFSESYAEDYTPQVTGPTNRKPGMFQKWAWRATYLPRGGDGGDTLGILDMETWVVLGFPCPTRENPMLITPGYAARFLDGPDGVDLPGTIYDVYVQFRWLGKLNDCWGYDLVFTPGIYTDFDNVTSDAWRFTGRAVASYQWSPSTQLLFGVGYFDREDVSALPVAGAIITPNDDVRWELIFPRPRYARRYYAACDREDWWYVVAEFGGGSWAIDRAAGANDVVTLRDYRLMLGKEVKLNGGASRRLEAGYVFGREIEFLRNPPPSIDLESTFIVRAGITF